MHLWIEYYTVVRNADAFPYGNIHLIHVLSLYTAHYQTQFL